MRLDFRRWVWVPLVFLLLASFTGCVSLGQGFGEAVLQSGEKQDMRQCWIRGRAFPGTLEAITLQERAAAKGRSERSVLKVMMVHGIGSHVPGYSTRIAENIARAMSLDRVQEKFKEFQLSSTRMAGQDLGVLRVTRYLDQAGVQEMLFYELTWDSIVEAEKQTITFDNAGEYSFRRTGFNDKMKRFVNDTVPDVLMYNGRFRKPIQFAVGQSICWMMSEDWDGLPSGDRHSCVGLAPSSLDHLDDEFVFITHSLGSRITVDALQTIAVKAQETPDFQERARARCRTYVFPSSCSPIRSPCCSWGRRHPRCTARLTPSAAPTPPEPTSGCFRKHALSLSVTPTICLATPSPRSFSTSTWTRACVSPWPT